MKKLLFTLLACLSMGAMAQEGLILHYDFVGDEGTTVRDKSDSHHDGTLKGSASVADGTVYLGNEDGYIDLGEGIGKQLKQLRQFTVAVRYKVDSEASLKGQGYFLWAFSTMEFNTQTEGRYHAYKLNVQRAENSVGGWKNETLMDLGKPSEKGNWQYVVYTQNDDEGRLFLNGRLVAFLNGTFTMTETFPKEAPTYNWMGRAPFKGDSYLKGTSIDDVRMYSTALTEKEVRDLSAPKRQPKLFVQPNEPIGEGKGIHPGRVVWVHSPGVASWDGETGLWVEDRWNDQEKADKMIRSAVTQLAGEKKAKKAWKALFKNFNQTHGRGNKGYQKGEKIAIKLNMNNAITHRDTIELNSSPFVTLALVRSLVNEAGVAQEDIIVCEPSRAITDSIYNKIHREFPDVVFIDNIGGEGRLKCEYYPEQLKYSVDNGKMARGLAKCVVDADYLINSALLKTHNGPGVTLTAKNWYGATDINLLWRKNAHNGISADKRHGKPSYKTMVDWIGHKDLGQKCLLFLIDGTYGSRDVNGAPSPKWQKAPFNNDWCCSIIVSQDPLACDVVGMDMLIHEWPEFGSFNYCDEYLREAATIPNPVTGVVYDPERDGKPLTAPLGLMEHADKDRRYTKLDMIYVKQ
ncbi:MAG: DUF362 domain-containing protein [Bacteroidaceae bacterium]|nr:DUF362 domain-containing protein [Bacteroidaceae bacterium]